MKITDLRNVSIVSERAPVKHVLWTLSGLLKALDRESLCQVVNGNHFGETRKPGGHLRGL